MGNDITLFLIRHGESIRNLQPDLMGQSPDEELSFDGRYQAELLGEYFRDHSISFDEIHCSPYKRALETCSLACEKFTKLQPLIDNNLREYSAGDMIDKSRKEVITGNTLKKMNDLGMSFKFPNGESLYEVEDRARIWFRKNIEKPRDEEKNLNIAVFSHGMVIKCLLHFIMQFNQQMTWRVSIDNTSVTILKLKDGHWFLKRINDTRHLEGNYNL